MGLRPRVTKLCSALMPALVVFGAVLLSFWGCGKGEQKTQVPPPEVLVAEVVQKDVPIYQEWVGTMDGLVNATIRAQVSGYLIKQNYREGDFVKKGQVLFEIDPRTFQAALAQAQGELARQEANFETAKLNLARVKPLAEQNALSKKDLDDALGREQAAQASVLAAKAAVQKAALDLEFTQITSPIGGIAGIAKAQLGNLVGPGSTEELTTVSTVDPIKVYIQLSEQEYLGTKRGTEEERQARARDMPLQLILADGSTYPSEGRFLLADRQVDVTTGTIKVATLFPNPGNFLRPGQFARVRAQLEVKKGALLVPQRSVVDIQGKHFVAVVGTDNKVDLRPVKTAEQIGSEFIISEGLNAGEKVIVEGVQKVKSGAIVNPKLFGAETSAAPLNAEAKPDASPSTEKR